MPCRPRLPPVLALDVPFDVGVVAFAANSRFAFGRLGGLRATLDMPLDVGLGLFTLLTDDLLAFLLRHSPSFRLARSCAFPSTRRVEAASSSHLRSKMQRGRLAGP